MKKIGWHGSRNMISRKWVSAACKAIKVSAMDRSFDWRGSIDAKRPDVDWPHIHMGGKE